MFTFTPTFAPSSPPVQLPEGTVIDYDEWTSKYATKTFVPGSNANLRTSLSLPFTMAITLSTALGLLFGTVWVLA